MADLEEQQAAERMQREVTVHVGAAYAQWNNSGPSSIAFPSFGVGKNDRGHQIF